MAKGVFITLEGGEGAGKSTQIRLLQQALSATGLKVVTTREPGGTEQAEKIRNLLVQRDGGVWDPLSEALLLSAARREHLVGKIWPALEMGEWVLSDRFADSTRAFQGYGMGLDHRTIETLYRQIAGDFEPDLTFILDLDPEKGLSRSDSRGGTEDRYERMGLAFHQRLRKGFLEIAKQFSHRCIVIDAAQDSGTVHGLIVKAVTERLLEKKAAHG